jgi:cytochrome c-type biogenesis protein CcmH/NrfF
MKSVLLVLVSLCLTASAVIADERSDALDKQATELYEQVFSPFCPGRSLNDCPSSKATDLKGQMRQKLEDGVSPEVVLKEVFETYGDQYRTVPQFQGVGALVWLVPIAFLATGLFIALGVSISRKKKASVGNGGPGSNQLSDTERRRIEDELSKLD